MIGLVLKSRYELTTLLSEGPIFGVYQARDRSGGREVCIRLIKKPYDQNSEFLDSLLRAIRRAGAAQHPGLEAVYDIEHDGKEAFVVGDLSSGQSLADRIRKLAPFSVPVSISTTIALLEALEALHRAGIAHGDVRPQNIAVRTDGQVRLQLAGIWEAYGFSPMAVTHVHSLMAPYLAPEVSAGADPSPASDIYSVGVLLYQLVTGRQPYKGSSPADYAAMHVAEPTPNPRTINPSVPAVLGEIVMKAMSKGEDGRYGTASELLKDLRALQDALRFGRTLAWPIGTLPGATPAKDPQPVAPRMSAIRDDADYAMRSRKRQERDVPLWLMLTIAFFGVVVVSLLGAWMVQNLNRPRLVTVPNIRGLSLPEARRMAEGMKLQLRISSTRENDEQVPSDHVLGVEPSIGDKVREGGTLMVRLSAGSRFVEVPDLQGLTADRAKSALGALDLKLDEPIEKVYDPEAATDTVVEQDPPTKSKVERQSRVKVKVNSGVAPPPSVFGSADAQKYSIKLSISDRDGEVEVRVDMVDERESKTIYTAMHQNGDEFEVSATGQGAEVTFKVFYNGELVREIKRRPEAETP
ncbi:MAG: protein kinase domain-containing protein [Fimbriimonas sp.]